MAPSRNWQIIVISSPGPKLVLVERCEQSWCFLRLSPLTIPYQGKDCIKDFSAGGTLSPSVSDPSGPRGPYVTDETLDLTPLLVILGRCPCRHDGDDGSAVVMPSGGRSDETYGGL